MIFDAIIVPDALREAYASLPDGARKAVAAAVTKLAGAATGGLFRRLWALIRPSPYERAARVALARAIASALYGRSDLEAIGLATALTREPFAGLVTRVLTFPNEEVNTAAVRRAFADSVYELDLVGIDELALVVDLRERLLQALRTGPSAEARDQYIATGVEQLRAGQQRIERSLEALVTFAGVDASADDGPWHSRLAEAKALYDAGLIQSALRVWERLIGDTASDGTMPPTLLARLYNNVGAVRIVVGQYGDAVDAFRRAVDHAPERVDIVANLAQAELLAGKKEDALRTAERALALDGNSIGAWAVRIQASDVPVDVETIPPAIRSAQYVLVARAITLPDAEETAAVTLLREALRRGPRDPQLLLLLAESLYAGLFPRSESDPVPGDLVAEIARLGKEVSDALASTESTRLRARALIMQGVAAALAGAEDRGSGLFQRAVDTDPSYERARFAAAQVQLQLGNGSAALYLLDGILAGDRHAMWHALRVQVLVGSGRSADVDEDVRAAMRGVSTRHEEAVAVMLAEALLDADRLDLFDSVLPLVERAATPAMVHVFCARAALRRGDRPRAEHEYRAAAESASAAARPGITMEFASYLYRERDYAQAAEWFANSQAWASDERAGMQYGRSAFHLGAFDTVLAVTRAFGDPEHQPAWAADLEARVAIERDDLYGARTALHRLLDIGADDVDARIRYAYILIRSDDADAARDVLTPLEERDDLRARDAVNLAQLLVEVDRPGPALRQAYAALRLAPDDPRIQYASLVNVFLRQRGADEAPAEVFTRDQVTPDTWLSLRAADGETLEYVVLARGPHDVRRHELLADDPRARPFLGLKPGDEITLRARAANEKRFRVMELKSAMLHTFHDTMNEFQARFPDFAGVQAVHVGEGHAFNPEPILRMLLGSQERDREVIALYREKRFPVGAIAGLQGRTSLRTFQRLLYDATMPIYVEEPAADRLEASLGEARKDAVVLTATGLATLHALGRVELLQSLYQRRLAPQSLVDELTLDITEWEEARAHGGYLSPSITDDHRLAVAQVTADDIEAPLRIARELREAVLGMAEVNPRPLGPRVAEDEKLRQLVGASSWDAAALAGRAVALFADDWGLRNLARVERGVSGCSTYALLRVAHQRGLLADDELHRLVVRLIEFRHTFILVNVALLYQELAEQGFQTEGPVLRLLDVLADPAVSVENAVHVAVELIRELSLSPLGHGAVGAVTMLALERITTGRDLSATVRLFAATAGAAFKLLPRDGDVVLERIRAFVAAKRAGQSVT